MEIEDRVCSFLIILESVRAELRRDSLWRFFFAGQKRTDSISMSSRYELNGMCIARKKSSIESSCSCSFSESYIPRLSWALSNKIIIRDTIPLRREKKSSSLYRSIVQLNLSNEYTRRYRREKLDETRLVSLRIDFHWKSSAKTRKEVVRVDRNRVPIESIERMRSNW